MKITNYHNKEIKDMMEYNYIPRTKNGGGNVQLIVIDFVVILTQILHNGRASIGFQNIKDS